MQDFHLQMIWLIRWANLMFLFIICSVPANRTGFGVATRCQYRWEVWGPKVNNYSRRLLITTSLLCIFSLVESAPQYNGQLSPEKNNDTCKSEQNNGFPYFSLDGKLVDFKYINEEINHSFSHMQLETVTAAIQNAIGKKVIIECFIVSKFSIFRKFKVHCVGF